MNIRIFFFPSTLCADVQILGACQGLLSTLRPAAQRGITPSLIQPTSYLRELEVGHIKVPHARAPIFLREFACA